MITIETPNYTHNHFGWYCTDRGYFPQFYRFFSSYSIQSKWKRTHLPRLAHPPPSHYAINGATTTTTKTKTFVFVRTLRSISKCYHFELVLLPVLMGQKKQKSFDLTSSFYWLYKLSIVHIYYYLFMRFYCRLSTLCAMLSNISIPKLGRKSNENWKGFWNMYLTFGKCHKTVVTFNSFSISAVGMDWCV